MESVLATVHQEPTQILKTESAKVAHPTASAVSPTPSAMPATLATISTKESASLLLSPAQPVNSDTMESATHLVLKEPANKEVSVKELVQLEHGTTTEDVTEPAQPNTLLPMLASIAALKELLLSMEFVK